MLIKPKEPTPHFREAEKMNELLLTKELAFARFGGVTLWFSHSIVYSKIKKTFTNSNLIENTRVRSQSQVCCTVRVINFFLNIENLELSN